MLQYVTSNVLLSYLLIKLTSFDYPRNLIILTSTILVAFLLGFRLVFAVIYLVKYYAQRPWKTLSNFGSKLRSKVAHHMMNNRIISKRELAQPKNKIKNRRKVNLKKNLDTVGELSNEDS